VLGLLDQIHPYVRQVTLPLAPQCSRGVGLPAALALSRRAGRAALPDGEVPGKLVAATPHQALAAEHQRTGTSVTKQKARRVATSSAVVIAWPTGQTAT
jgi:hypothetical protein